MPVCGVRWDQERASDSLNLELQTVVSFPVWVLGTELGSRAGAASTLSHPISSVQLWCFYLFNICGSVIFLFINISQPSMFALNSFPFPRVLLGCLKMFMALSLDVALCSLCLVFSSVFSMEELCHRPEIRSGPLMCCLAILRRFWIGNGSEGIVSGSLWGSLCKYRVVKGHLEINLCSLLDSPQKFFLVK